MAKAGKPAVSAGRALIGALAAYRLAHMAVDEDGPFEVFTRTRNALQRFAEKDIEKREWIHTGATCFWCWSFWTGVAVAPFVASRVRDIPTAALAASGGAVLLYQLMEYAELAVDPIAEEQQRNIRPFRRAE